ncbi:aminotransferase class III-fold pyridoxal phosphate-dependent enzyme [Bradyrhizobium sp. LHD-71]|uniref:aminotransferase class III-fold pyridoxal phosphate-dependent enzyme n=1 Tax=Bradyrhizobium sp. LHD-71 TaxID=3072141 RepID=UPI00280FA379|nr:aminotransferase class III-fold pyridoxal phosphate-dependent enzyme [Bradyrhizobium sp. LHD-71]MDQ8728451.1 aminotransferase class III-fold pyridoxal phosphate-dependent enzyme [Bradyrhizobium sp. LHD-71]
MDSPLLILSAAAIAAIAIFVLPRAHARLLLSQAKHRSLAGHSKLSRRIARLVPFYEFDTDEFFNSDGAPPEIAGRRRNAFFELARQCRERFAKGRQMTADVSKAISDLQFVETYRVPFQYSRLVREHLGAGTFVESSAGVTLTDLDGNVFYDLTGSYGVNIFGYDFYKDCIAGAEARARALGPVLGSYHPVIAANVARLKTISQLDEVSFHMSGTEAVMQAVRLARYHTGRTHLVRFAGAYHGWWGDVQPGVGNPVSPHETYTLADMSERTLKVLRTRRDIACVLVNPSQALHPNINPPSDSALVDSSRSGAFDRGAYAQWLKQLRDVCTERNIVLIFDEVFVGFRLALGGAQEYFGVRADLVTYGKSLAGGLPVGAVCGRSDLMRRFRDDRPADVCFARGTFNSHPYVMLAMDEFLTRLEAPQLREIYASLDDTWDARARQLNERLAAKNLPVRVCNMQSIWLVTYTEPSRYNWMLQYYLRLENLALSWIGTGRFIFSLNYTDADFAAVADHFVAATEKMQRDGWWWRDATVTNKGIRRQILKEMFARRRSHRNATVPQLQPQASRATLDRGVL